MISAPPEYRAPLAPSGRELAPPQAETEGERGTMTRERSDESHILAVGRCHLTPPLRTECLRRSIETCTGGVRSRRPTATLSFYPNALILRVRHSPSVGFADSSLPEGAEGPAFVLEYSQESKKMCFSIHRIEKLHNASLFTLPYSLKPRPPRRPGFYITSRTRWPWSRG